MGESKHTPGPWKFGEMSEEILAGKATIATMPSEYEDTWQERPGERNANAALIAAAPLMLEALRSLIFPEAPSADDLMLLFLASGVTSAQQEAFRPFVEKYRAAQAKARAAIKAATGGAE